VTAFIIEKEFPGFSRGKKFEKMGWRGSPTGELIFEDCQVPKENVLGKVGEGALILMGGLNTERTALAAMSLGLMRGAYEWALKYSKERVQFGKPICSFQMIQSKTCGHGHENRNVATHYVQGCRNGPTTDWSER